jgi:hypothetical protein
MTAGLLACGSFAAALGGFSALALAMDRHYEDAFGRGRSPGRWRRWMQAGGALLLAASLVASLRLQGGSVGWVLWFGTLTAAALGTVAVATWRPAQAARVSVVAAVLALLAVGGCLLLN